MIRTIALIVFALALGGCERRATNLSAGAAGSEVLPGSTSDAMLDTNQSRAQAPLVVVRPVVNSSSRGAEFPISDDSEPSDANTKTEPNISASKPATPSSTAVPPKPKPAAR